MLAPDGNYDPFAQGPNPALPPTTAGAFNAWGMFRHVVNDLMPQYVADMAYYLSIGPGVYV